MGYGRFWGLTGHLAGFTAGAYTNKEKGDGKTVTHTGSLIQGREAVTLQSGQDTAIIGSKVIGDKVTIKTGRNLTIASLQDTNDYKNTSSNKGVSVSLMPGGLPTVGANTGKGRINSQYASVTDQAGIYAGKEGYDIEAANTTTVTGAVIVSRADKEKNTLTTKSLVMHDIDNTLHYTAKKTGLSLTNEKGALLPINPEQSIPITGNGHSVTRSAMAEGIITVADTKSLAAINHDTANALNKLNNTFNVKDVKEKQALADAMAKEGFNLIGDIAVRKQKELVAKSIAATANKDEAGAKNILQKRINGVKAANTK